MRLAASRWAVVTFAAAGALLTGCQGKTADTGSPAPAASSAPADNGVAALPADEILNRAKTALKAVESFRAKGSVVDDGQRLTLNLKVRGSTVGGWIAMGQAKVELLAIGGHQYIRPNEKFWATNTDSKKAHTIAKLMADKWVKLPDKSKDFSDLFSTANIDDLLKPDGSLTKGAAKDINGVPTIALIADGPNGGTLYVATVGEAYPIRLVAPDDSDAQIDFSDFGAAFADLTTPPEAQIIDLEELNRG